MAAMDCFLAGANQVEGGTIVLAASALRDICRSVRCESQSAVAGMQDVEAGRQSKAARNGA